ncbi:MAG: hypothetical protein ABSE89_08325 [Sedimentisphaerales bacterium]
MTLSREQIILEEYKAIRAEILLCLERRITIISYGLTSVGVLVGAGVTSLNYSHSEFAILVFLVVLPVTALYVLNIWLAETHRVRRASHYNWYIEKKLAAVEEFADKPLEWESRIHDKNDPHRRFKHYNYTVCYFSLLFAISVGVGLYLLLTSKLPKVSLGYRSIICIVVAVGFGIFILWWHIKKAQGLIDKFDEEPTYP